MLTTSVKAFALNIAIEHARFEKWAEISGLTASASSGEEDNMSKGEMKRQNEASQRFQRCVQFHGPAIIPLLSELHVILTQLSDFEDRYIRFMEYDESNPDNTEADCVTDAQPISGFTGDIAEPNVATSAHSLATRTMAQHLSSGIRKQSQRTVPKPTGYRTNSNLAKPRRPFNQIIVRLSRSRKIVTEPRRLFWTFRDKTRCLSKLLQVRQLNDALQESLGHGQMDVLVDSTNHSKLMLTQVQSGIDDIKMVTGNLHALIAASYDESRLQSADDALSTWSGSTVVDTNSFPAVQQRSYNHGNAFMNHAARFMLEVIDQSSTFLPSAELSDGTVASLRQNLDFDKNLRMTAVLPDGRSVWVEWRSYEIQATSNLEGSTSSAETLSRINRLVSLLRIPNKPREFCATLPGLLLGHAENPARYSLCCSSGSPKLDTAFVIVMLLDGTHAARSQSGHCSEFGSVAPCTCMPSVGYTRAFAAPTSYSSLRRDFKDLGNPFLTGFEYASSAGSTTTTTRPPKDPWRLLYVHPDYVGAKQALGYRKIYDIYSLGIVFIELACWSPIGKILAASEATEYARNLNGSPPFRGAEANGASKAVPILPKLRVDQLATVRQNVLGGRWNVLERVRSSAGDRYHDVVKACLTGTKAFGMQEYSKVTDNNASADLLEAFHRIVIEPLKSIKV